MLKISTTLNRVFRIYPISKRIFMEFKLTTNRQYSHHDKDGADRNYISYFLNGVLILKQKIPFDTNWELEIRKKAIYLQLNKIRIFYLIWRH